MKKVLFLLCFLGMVLVPAAAEEGFNFNLDIGIDYLTSGGTTLIGVNLQPDIAVGKFGVGLKGSLFFEIGGEDGLITIHADNWIPDFSEDESFFDYVSTAAGLYLPVFRYVRYGYKGDPLHVRVGQLDAATLGTGMFLTSYTNTLLLPQTPLVGGILDIDGRLFNFPYLGFEALSGNLAELDVLAGRLYARPLAFIDFPIIRDIQVGGSYVVDRNPALHYTGVDAFNPMPVSMFGADVIVPIVDMSLVKLRLFGDLGFQPDPEEAADTASAYRLGFDGHILGLLTYRGNLLFPTPGYKPDYFNVSYDINRDARYNADGMLDDTYYLNAGAGFSLLGEVITFDLDITGEVENAGGAFTITDPVMNARFHLGEELLGFFYLDAVYKKQFPGSNIDVDTFLEQVVTLSNSEVRANISVKYSVVVVDMGYVIPFDENGEMQTPDITIGGKVKLL